MKYTITIKRETNCPIPPSYRVEVDGESLEDALSNVVLMLDAHAGDLAFALAAALECYWDIYDYPENDPDWEHLADCVVQAVMARRQAKQEA